MAATLSALLKRSSLTDPEEILAACDAALQSTKTDTHAQHARVVALLKLDRFDDALRTFDAAGDQLRQLAAFEYSYALYKTGRLDDAIAAARRLSATHRGAAHVEAQASYRAERFARSAQLYEQLQAGPESEAVDLRVNATAVDAQVQFAAPGAAAPAAPAASRADLEAFETTYNLATAAAARGELSKAGVLLRRAEELCRSSGELTPGEIEAELLPIQVQQLYVATLSGNQAEAERLMSEIDTAKFVAQRPQGRLANTSLDAANANRPAGSSSPPQDRLASTTCWCHKAPQ
ncbi:Signal recognition particle core component [Ascosphaera acerosa]|nr:Signal recognition particle core component [Ascosphaera acerosa]